APSIARLKAGWQAEYETWKRRRLDDLEPVLRVGGRDLCQSRAGEGQGGHARGDRRAARRAEGGARGGERVSRVDGELGGAAPRPPRAGVASAAAAHRRWASGDLGRRPDGVPAGGRAALLESSPRERARHAAQEAP